MDFYGQCALCKVGTRICRSPEGQHPAFCSTTLYPEALAKAAAEYAKPEVGEFAYQASVQEAASYIDRDAQPPYLYPVKPRIQEIIEFSRRMGYQRLGMAFCGGLHQEAGTVTKILQDHGFEVVSAMCKVGGVDKEAIGIQACDKIKIGQFEAMCNPIAQAEVLNAAATEFNILMGLCVGHDSLFLKYSQAMTTVFAVKDRVLGHNPMAAIYNYNSYYQRFQQDRLKEVTVIED